jgi:hypothetical protein
MIYQEFGLSCIGKNAGGEDLNFAISGTKITPQDPHQFARGGYQSGYNAHSGPMDSPSRVI